MDKLLTVEELCDYLHIRPSTIYKKTSGRQIPFVKVGSKLRFSQASIEGWLKSNSFSPDDLN